MKREIIPTILVSDRLEFVRRLGIMQGKIPVAQMDIMDGKFVANTTFTDPKIAAHYKVDYELDLMVEDPEPFLQKWHDTLPQPPPLKGGGKVVRAFVHAEIKKPLAPLLKKIKSYGWEAGVAINPDTGWGKVEPFLPSPQPSPKGRGGLSMSPHPPLSLRERALGEGQGVGVGEGQGEGIVIDSILFMTVYPGQNAAPFQKKVIKKVKSFHVAYPNVPITVDGGVNEKTLPALVKAGVTRFAVGSAIWAAPDPISAYKRLLKVINS